MLPDGYELRPLDTASPSADAARLARAYDRNRAHLEPWDPVRSDAFYTDAGQQAVIDQQCVLQERGLLDPWLLWHGDDVVGRGNIQNIVRGAMQGGTLGYWVDGAHTRRGLATAVVEALVERGVELGLHRLEADTMVENTASQAVLERCGFERFGLAPRFLYLRGAWRDHVLFQRLLHDDPPGAANPPSTVTPAG